MIAMGERIKKYRRKKGLTQEALALSIGVSGQAVSKWENGANFPDVSMILPLAEALEVSPNELFGVTDLYNQEEINDVLRKVRDIWNEDRLWHHKNRDAYWLLRESLEKFPENQTLMLKCLDYGARLLESYWVKIYDYDSVAIMAVLNECIRQTNYLVNYSNDTLVISEARTYLAVAYARAGEKEKGMEIAGLLPGVKSDGCNSGYVKARILHEYGEWNEEIKIRQQDILTLFHQAIRESNWLISAYSSAGESKMVIELAQHCIDMIKAMFNSEDYCAGFVFRNGYYDDTIPFYYAAMELEYVRISEFDKAVEKTRECYDWMLNQLQLANSIQMLKTPLFNTIDFTDNCVPSNEEFKTDFINTHLHGILKEFDDQDNNPIVIKVEYLKLKAEVEAL